MMRYIPFIIISLILYTLFFYNSQQPDLLSANKMTDEMIINEKTVQLDFEKVAKEEQPIPTPALGKKEVTTEAESAKLISQQKRALKQLQASIKLVPASEGALLKGEFYERDFHLDLPAPPVKERKPKKKKAKTKLTPIKQKSSSSVAKEKAIKKTKHTFKKQVSPSSLTNKQELQEAIAVSGNKPHYPKKAKADKKQGTVTIKFTVTMQGKTKNAEVRSSSGHAILDHTILEFVKKERFMPALKGIEKVSSEQQFSFTFSLK